MVMVGGGSVLVGLGGGATNSNSIGCRELNRKKGVVGKYWKEERRKRVSCSCRCQLGDVASTTSAVYGSLLLGGGLFAFNKSRSKGSLFGGLAGAALMAAAYSLIQAQETRAYGEALGFGSCLLFSSVFGIRLAATRKLIPAGPLLGLSVGALVVFVAAYLQDI